MRWLTIGILAASLSACDGPASQNPVPASSGATASGGESAVQREDSSRARFKELAMKDLTRRLGTRVEGELTHFEQEEEGRARGRLRVTLPNGEKRNLLYIARREHSGWYIRPGLPPRGMIATLR